ncbi:MAG: hypothetical protein A2086_08135 [Spirochaetes bacterium GWD1_27_9]|nr:MAG: hypothetical protein A2Z98_16285 [Spirochaetes bacterium GWB1_27_13]OHD24127.1 MAG: hypothetical protein A2Y34_09400 [Spirochaetes bacterium GWC1_27_15]OHD34489.1 MAG: hypothetical protein A2086_08135 [Spirochaetes bacterium GWD1_27_9]
MKEKFYKALEKISTELLNMEMEDFYNILETHKNGVYAQTLKSIDFLLTENIYELHKTNISVCFEIPKIDFKIDENFYETIQTKEIKIEKRTLDIKDNQWLSQAA